MSNASTISTGGGGVVFEQHVTASFLGSLLTGALLPVFTDATAQTVHLQCKRLGWNTDDLVIVGRDSAGQSHKLVAQVKRTFVLSASNEDCCKTLRSAWADFNNGAAFDAANDGLILIVYLGTNRILRDVETLLTQARASSSSDDFGSRLAGTGLLNKQSKADYATIKTIVAHDANAVSDAELWRFLRSFHVLSFDLTGDASQDEAMIKSLLKQLAIKPGLAPEQAWNALVTLAGESAPKGRSLTRADLPEALLSHYRSTNPEEHEAISRLRDHSRTVLNRIKDAGLNGFSFSRTAAMSEIVEARGSSQVVLIVGGAGSGKSVLAKRFAGSLASNELVCAFAAEEFRLPHIDAVLAQANISLNWQALRAILAMQSSKTFLVEGLERLLEAEDRGAFIDFLNCLSKDTSIRLIITCRDYHANTVERVFLAPSGVPFSRVFVGDLNDEELAAATKVFAALAQPLSHPPLRRLLRNPFLLMRAASLSWSPTSSIPMTERTLRERFWSDLVRRDDQSQSGLPSRRASALTQISLNRARKLRPYVEVPNDEEAIHALATDGLIVFDGLSAVRAAPAHDVFEDWALVLWLSDQFAEFEADALAFAKSRDQYPALRRAYRKWLQEMMEAEPLRGVEYVTRVTQAHELAHWLRDDTLVGVFQSSFAATFFDVFSEPLLEHDASLLQQAIHIVRVSSKTISPLASQLGDIARIWHVPAGPAWPNLLAFVAKHWERIPDSVHPLVLGFAEDWANGISYQTPYPDGAGSAGQIIEHLLPLAQDDHRADNEKLRVLQLLLKVPKSVDSLFRELVSRRLSATSRRDDSDAETLGELLMKPLTGFAAYRDYPDLVVSLCLAVWMPGPAARDHNFWSGFRDVNSVFGLRDYQQPSFFPPSAHQGPFLLTLRSHPTIGLDFVLSLVNQCIACYGEQRAPLQYVEPAASVDIVTPSGQPLAIWANLRLWNAYRATSVMPSLLECALMALESWLLQIFSHELKVRNAEDWLLAILERSNNVCLVAVVASVCVAHPQETPRASAALLRCREFIELDRMRGSQESSALAIGGLGYDDQLFQKERIASNKLPHRREDLEQLARQLQFTAARETIWEILDAHRARLPHIDAQDDDDRLWRLALDRMDMRRYEMTGQTPAGNLMVQMRAPDPDVQAVIDRDQPGLERFNKSMGLFLWGNRQYERRADAAESAGEWAARLQEAKASHGSGTPVEGVALGGVPFVAAVCLRDHWDELDPTDRAWCETVVAENVGRPPRGTDSDEWMMRSSMDGVAACASMVAKSCLNRGLAPDPLFSAILHFNREARDEAIKGVAVDVIPNDVRLARYCAWAMVTYAKARIQIENQERSIAFESRSGFMAIHSRCLQAAKKAARDQWYDRWPDIRSLDFTSWADRQLARSLILLFQNHPELAEAQHLFVRLATLFAERWKEDDRRNDRDDRDFEFELDATNALAGFVLDCATNDTNAILSPIVAAFGQAPSKIVDFIRLLIMQEDNRSAPTAFWHMWSQFANAAQAARWIDHVDRRHSDGRSVIGILFFDIRWRDGIRSWTHLGKHHKDVESLFEQLPASVALLESFAQYLFNIGAASLPHALVLISKKFGDSLGTSIEAGKNLTWYFNTLLDRLMFEDRAALRQSPALREATMHLLDALVSAGSSIAFQMRDDFVTPTLCQV